MNKTTETARKIDTLGDSGNPTLIIIRGLPGSGKSYLAAALQKSIGKDKVVSLDPDATDYTSQKYIDHSKALTAEDVDAKFHPYRFLRAQAHQAIIAHQVIIWNQAFTNADGFDKTIINLQGFAAEHNTQLPILVVEVAVNHRVAKERVAKREAQGGHGVPEDAFARFIGEYVSFSNKGHKTVAVNGEDDVTVSVASVMQALQELRKK